MLIPDIEYISVEHKELQMEGDKWVSIAVAILFLSIMGGYGLGAFANKEVNFVKQCGIICKLKVLEVDSKSSICKCR